MLTFKNYDDAVIDYFKKIYQWSVYAQTDRAFQVAGMEFGDKVPLPLISVYRTDFALNPFRNTPLFFRGKTLALTETKVNKERVFPMLFNYQVDVWGDDHDVVAQLYSELLFAVTEMPIITVDFAGSREPLEAHLSIIEVNQNNEPSQIATRGRLYRYSVTYQVHVYIIKQEEHDVIRIVPQFFDFDANKLD